MHVHIIIPTYNEKENILLLVPEIQSILKKGKLSGKILIVDDSSPDGTAEAVRMLAKKHKNVELMIRTTDRGFAQATIAGFEKALKEKSEYIVQLDADFSHNPQDMLRLLEERKHADVIIGSRYVAGGQIKNWNMLRRVISRMGNFYARNMLHIPVRDLTGSFRCYHVNVLKKLDFLNIQNKGYGFLTEVLFRLHEQHRTFKEIPITFTERQKGKSKFNLSILFESFWNIFLLRLRR